MSLLPLLFDDSLCCRPSRPEWDLFAPAKILYQDFPTEALNELRSQLSQIEKDTSISVDKDQFRANVDVQQFRPEEIKVKITGDREVTVEGKHEEQQDEHGYISRHFVRKYILPEDCDVKRVHSKLSSDGVLSVCAPKLEQGKQLEHREVPVVKMGKPVKKIQHKKAAEPKK